MNLQHYVVVVQTPTKLYPLAVTADLNFARYIAQTIFLDDAEWWRNIVLDTAAEKQIASWEFTKESKDRCQRRNTSPNAPESLPEVIEIQRTGDSGHAIMRGVDGEPDDESGRN